MSRDVGAVGTSEEAYRRAFERAPFGALLGQMGSGRQTGTILDVNDALCALLGYSRDELVGADMTLLGDPDDADVDLDELRERIVREPGGVVMVRRLVRSDGTPLWARLHAAAVGETPDGRRLGVLTVHDVTEELRSEQERRRVDALVARTAAAVIGMTPDGVVTTWNPGAERLYGIPADAAVGRSIELVIPAELHDERRELFARVRAGEEIANHPTSSVTRDGRIVDVALTLSPVRDLDGEVRGVTAIVRDVTAARRAEALTQGVLEAALDAFITVEPDATIVSFNPAAERMFGRRAADVLGKSAAELLVAERDRAAYLDGLRRMAAGELASGVRYVIWGLRADGTEFPAEMAGSRVAGDVPYLTAHVRDITAERRAARERALVARLTRRALEGAEYEALLHESAEAVAQIVACDDVLVIERLDDHAAVRVQRGAKIFGPAIGRTFRLGSHTMPAPAEGIETVTIESAADLPEAWQASGIAHAVIAPVAGPDGRAAGWLCALSGERREAHPGDARFMDAIANVLATALARVRAEAEIRHRALHDELTGLPNRTLLADRIEHALHRAGEGDTVAVLFLASTGSSSSTTRSATRPATSCSSRSPAASSARCGPTTRSPGSAATSSRSSARGRAATVRRSASPRTCSRRSPARTTSARATARSSSPRASASSSAAAPVTRTACCATRTSPCTGRRTSAAGGSRSSTRSCAAASSSARGPSATCATPSRARSSSCTSSRSSRSATATCAASRRCCAGAVPSGGSSTPTSSSRSPRRAGSSSRSAAGCWPRRAGSSSAGTRCSASRSPTSR